MLIGLALRGEVGRDAGIPVTMVSPSSISVSCEIVETMSRPACARFLISRVIPASAVGIVTFSVRCVEKSLSSENSLIENFYIR